MKHEKIDPKIWIISRGLDGKLQAEIDPARLEKLVESADDIADTLISAAGTFEIAETRLW